MKETVTFTSVKSDRESGGSRYLNLITTDGRELTASYPLDASERKGYHADPEWVDGLKTGLGKPVEVDVRDGKWVGQFKEGKSGGGGWKGKTLEERSEIAAQNALTAAAITAAALIRAGSVRINAEFAAAYVVELQAKFLNSTRQLAASQSSGAGEAQPTTGTGSAVNPRVAANRAVSVHLSGGSGSDEPGSPPAQGPPEQRSGVAGRLPQGAAGETPPVTATDISRGRESTPEGEPKNRAPVRAHSSSTPEQRSEAGETFASPSPAGAMAAAQQRQAPSASGRGTANPAPDVRRGTASEHRSGAGTKISAESPGNVEPEALAPEPLSAGADTPGGEGSAITEPGPSPSGSFPPSERATLPQMRELVIVFGSQKAALRQAAMQLGRSFGKLDDLSSEEANTLLFSEAAKP